MTDIEPVQSQFIDAVGTAEIARDMLTYAHRDASRLANAAMEMTGKCVIDVDPIGSAFALAAQAGRLEQKLKTMLEKLDPMLAPAVAAERATLNKQFS